ncbi:hypothetical protein [Massilia sp. PWRC2]|uniref:hypothetical protein n=1 Tax=Massilia sp. PWRC2 TaxID=2804626 RepID=UPI003CED15F1
MNILHHAEAVFTLAAALAVGSASMLPQHTADAAASAAAAAAAAATAATPRATAVATPSHVAVVKVAARRLTPAQKMRSLADERALARAAAAPRG